MNYVAIAKLGNGGALFRLCKSWEELYAFRAIMGGVEIEVHNLDYIPVPKKA
jgi:hypothetical protein